MPVHFVEFVFLPVALLSLLVIGVAIWRSASLRPGTPRLSAFLLTIVGAILLNAAICGMLSSVKGRYQMRVAWLLPLLAIGLVDPKRGVHSAPAGVRNGDEGWTGPSPASTFRRGD